MWPRSGCCCRWGRRFGVFVLFNWLPRKMDRGDQMRPRSTWMRQKLSFWPYLIAGALSWYGFQESGLHPALGLLPIVPTLPHADRAFGIFSEAEKYLTDLLNHSEHLLKHPVEIVLFFFGLVNAGVEFSIDRRADLAGSGGAADRQACRHPAVWLDRGLSDAAGPAQGHADPAIWS